MTAELQPVASGLHAWQQMPALIVLGPLVTGILAPVLALRSVRWMRALAAVVLAATLALAAAALAHAIVEGPIHYKFGGWAPPWGIEYVIDPLSGAVAVLVSFFALLVFFGLAREGGGAMRSGAFHALYLLLVAGLLGIALTGDLFNLYVFLEISALAGYALVAAGGNRGAVAAYRYLIIGSVGATFWVLGLAYLYALTGTLNMADMSARLPALLDSRAAVAGLSFIVAGLAIKMALFPVHGWQPDAYTYAPASVMPFVSAVTSKVSVYVLLRVLYSVFLAQGPAAMTLEVLGWVAAAGIVGASVLALAQRDIRRMLAYSSVAQIGYIVLGLAIGNALALTGALLHILNHAVMKGCMFVAVAGIRARTGKTDIPALAGLGARMPWTAAAFTTAAVAMIGLPPTCGFFSKLYLVSGAVQAGAWPFVAALAASTLLGAVYFFRVIEQLYFREPAPADQPEAAPAREAPAAFLVPALVLAALVLILGVFNQAVVEHVLRFAVPRGVVG
ncbi:MAG: proton-conducting transporter membrane subunit [Elusimicrobiota bacterium]